jgi:DNA-binding MarR family transcriptional regulator
MAIAKGARGTAGPPAEPDAVRRCTAAVSTLFKLWKNDVERATPGGLTFAMAVALGALSKLPDQVKVSELARSLECNMGNLSGTLDRLEESGYVERLVCEADRRARFIRLTVKGRKAALQMTENFHAGDCCAALKQMSVQQLEAMTEVLDQLNGAVKALRQD